ncbi:hypothetical protein R1T16_11970 [Flavobacterium sp. DG1-102-2]|uniref:hypothetical protein n=1 Tax=Flavobacterium sp. DG1-102-2 TaxID=3081663 RepID=UPI00294A0F06|nr:hypothetical protein [Flavobacterium sp. DG1-102-2]MDV6169142.1 hypothetical protein [Flavobacterium sp. DG1-102-2]
MKAYEKVFISSLVVLAAVLYTELNRKENIFPENIKHKSVSRHPLPAIMTSSGVDSVAIKQLLPLFKIKKDEYDPNSIIYYREKSIPDLCHGNAAYCYFEQVNNVAGNLRFCFQVQTNEWMFIKKCQFLVDGIPYEYYPENLEYYPGDKAKVCEWFDDSVNENNIRIIKAVSTAADVKVKITGRHNHTIISIPQNQIKSIFNTLSLFIALNGNDHSS